MRNTAIVLSFLGAIFASWPAQADQLVTDLSEHQISIRSNFTGTEILIFGAIEAENPTDLVTERDIVVVVTGPEGPVTVRRKDRIAGIWINYDAVRFERAILLFGLKHAPLVACGFPGHANH